MRPFSFIHAADLHIDSPFRGVTADAPDVARALYSSTFQAFDALIETTVEREADFLLVAGDVYDGSDRSLRAQLRLRDGLVRLAEGGIRSFIVHGNHDPLDSKVTALNWPKEAHFFGKKLESIPVSGADGEPVAMVSGISFPKKEESRNLASKFSRQQTDLFQIGLLHCNVGGDTGHENYAPCSLEDLINTSMDYWALGHVHTRTTLSESPWVVYPGNIQGRNIREPGARGCYYVRVDETGDVTSEFIPLDVVRWSELEVAIDGIETVDALELAICEKIESELASADGRALVCRVALTGRGSLHPALRQKNAADQILEHVRDRFSSEDPFIWLQRLALESRPQLDLSDRMGRADLLSEVLATAKNFREETDGLDTLYREALAKVWDNTRVTKAHLDRPTDPQVDSILQEAELLSLDLLEDEE